MATNGMLNQHTTDVGAILIGVGGLIVMSVAFALYAYRRRPSKTVRTTFHYTDNTLEEAFDVELPIPDASAYGSRSE